MKSNKWLQRQSKDLYVKKAKKLGYRSRAAFKLIELDDRFRFFSKGIKVVDLGSAPGGWCQVAAERSNSLGDKGQKGRVVGLDIKEILPFRHVVKYLIRKNYATGEKLKIPEPKTVTYFLGKAPQKDIKLSFEHSAYGWFTLQEGFNKLSFGSKSETLQKVVSFLKSDSYIKLIYT